MVDKNYIMDAITEEIADRTDAAELKGLADLLVKVDKGLDLTPVEYEWVCYLVANKREMEIREELE